MNQIEAQLFKDVFLNVSALYSVLKGTPQQGVRRAELKQGVVTAEAIDFMADVEIKAKRTLTAPYCFVYLRSMLTGDYALLPIDLQCELGEAFLRSDLNYDGAYRVLYYRAKNDRLQDRDEPMHFPEEPMNTEDILNGQL